MKRLYPVDVIDHLVDKYEPRELAELLIENACGRNISALSHEDLLTAFGDEMGMSEEKEEMYKG
jgi:hypothetical protein